MKKIFTLITGILLIFTVAKSGAQSFTMRDTVKNTVGNPTIVDTITNTTTGNIIIQWKCIGSDFPADWLSAFNICDDSSCYTSSQLWPSGAMKTSSPYSPGYGDFHMVLDLSLTTSYGAHFMSVRTYNKYVTADSTTSTFLINRSTTGVTTISRVADDIVLYPNPTREELNVVYNASLDIKNIAVYNIIGKVLAVYKVTDNNSANLNLENIPSGIYFVRLVNSRGDVVVTRKFTKQ